MILVEQQKEENVVEYVLMMWQVENLVRAMDFSIEKIEDLVLKKAGLDENSLEVEKNWYREIIRKMEEEGVKEEGHLSISKDCLLELSFLHESLLNELNDVAYKNIYATCTAELLDLKKKQVGKVKSDIEACIQGLYTFWLLKLSKKEITPETTTAMGKIAKLMAHLAKKYKEIMLNK